ncbi:hypothetical protein DFA_10761 [Cavenderia fasciculata]|uniref:Uncharacterized protein n=1 Tax=Cavenderia fasciculata TaxID=261658 RepID=F4QBB6_CACFS|nr:uncharacterized protein DFA_10761 [Cavenderia fasciculata]EGG14888.1 hypothetical protein DFA_10761 [Cavenderia fasciculata]|eukprot:XP_004351404.1 hypothetical protein DFA_10761 [Cavenderia fasciculata]
MDYDSSLAALSLNLRRLTLYNVELNDTILNLAQCRLERLVIYPVGVWRSPDNDLLLKLLRQTPTLKDLGIKFRSTQMTACAPLDTSALGQLQKFTFIGPHCDNLRGLITKTAFTSLINVTDLKLKFNELIAGHSRLRPSEMIQALPSLSKIGRLRLENFISPAEVHDKRPEDEGFTYLPWQSLTSLTHLYIERLLGAYTRRQVNHLLHDVRLIPTLQSLAIKSITMIDPPTLIATLDALPRLTYFKYATTPRMDCEQDFGTSVIHSSETSISLAILQYLETNPTIKRFSFTLDNEFGASVYPFRKLFSHFEDNSISQLHTSPFYLSDELTPLENKIKDLQNELTNLIQNSESMQCISLSSNIGKITTNNTEDRAKIGPNLELLSTQFLNTLDSKINPKSKLSFIKIDKCLIHHDPNNNNNNNNNHTHNNNDNNNNFYFKL